jgi:prevent-host-death family protein
MTTVNIHEAKTQLSALLSLVEQGQEHIVICKYGSPIAEIIPYKKKRRSSVSKSLRPTKVKADLTEPVSEDWELG